MRKVERVGFTHPREEEAMGRPQFGLLVFKEGL